MKIRYEIPLNIYLSGPTKESLSVQSNFQHEQYLVNLTLSDSDPLRLENVKTDTPFFRTIKYLIFTIENSTDYSGNKLQIPELVKDTDNHSILLEDLKSIANRVLRCIRNIGIVTNIKEYRILNREPKYYFSKWNVEITEDNENWERLFTLLETSPLLVYFTGRYDNENTGDLNVNFWPEIEEAIQDNLTPAPEQEFLTNSIEYLKEGNFRLSLIESIICLEIILSQFLERYLSIHKKIPKKRIKIFLSPEFGLTSRISGLLDLCLSENDLAEINFNEIFTAIKWRNKIIHRTGHLPENVGENDIRNKITNVLNLVFLLARKRDLIESSPELQKIALSIAEKYSTPTPKIWQFPRHRILVEFSYILSDQLPENDVVEKIVSNLIEIFKTRDNRFIPEEHMHVRFKVWKEIITVWAKGNIINYPKKEQAA